MYEYKVIPAPARAVKVKGLKTTGDRFAHQLDERLNAEADEGWEFLRAETLPCEERRGLTGLRKSFQTVLVFRRARAGFEQGAHVQGAVAHDPSPAFAPANDYHDDAFEPAQRAHDQTIEPVDEQDEAELSPTASARRRAEQLLAYGRAEPVLRPSARNPAEGAGRPEPTLRARRPAEDSGADEDETR